MTPWWAAVLAAIAGGLIGVLGSVAGLWLQTWTGRQERNHHERRDAYAEFARAEHDLRESVFAYITLVPSDALSTRVEAQAAFTRARYELERRGALVELLGPPAVRTASAALLAYIPERVSPIISRLSGDPRPPLDEAARQEIEAVRQELEKRYKAVMDAARTDLSPTHSASLHPRA